MTRKERLKKEIDSISDRSTAADYDYARMVPHVLRLQAHITNVMTDDQLDAKPFDNKDERYGESARETLNRLRQGDKLDGDSMEKLAIDILRRRVYDDVRSLARDALDQVLEGHVEADAIGEYIHESVDGAVCYTKDQYMYAWLLDDSDSYEDIGGGDGTDWSANLATKAFCNLKDEVETMVARCLDNAEWDNEDEEETA